MLDFVKGELVGAQLVEEGLFVAGSGVASECIENALTGLVFLAVVVLVILRHGPQKVVHVHALVNVQKESDSLLVGHVRQVHLLQLSHILQVLLVFTRGKSSLNIDDALALVFRIFLLLFFIDYGLLVQVSGKFDQILGDVERIAHFFTIPLLEHVVSNILSINVESVKSIG